MKFLKQVFLVAMISSVAFLQGAAIGLSLNERLLRAAENGHTDMVQYLVDKGADVNHADNYGKTALHHAAKNGHIEIVQYLVTQGADVNHADSNRRTALHDATANYHTEVIKYLVAQGADVNCADINGFTALHRAARNGHKEIVQYLVTHGADVNCARKHGQTALHDAAQYGDAEIVQCLVDKGAEVNHTDSYDTTALHHAAKNGHKEVVLLSLAYDAEPEVKILDTVVNGMLRDKNALEVAYLKQDSRNDNYLSTCAIIQAATTARKEMPLDVTSVLTRPLPSKRKAAMSPNIMP